MIANQRRPGRARLGPVLVSVVIVLICAGVLIPGIGSIQQAAQRTRCLGKNKQMGLAIHSFESAMGRFPLATIPNETLPPDKRFSWHFSISPFLEANDIYHRAKLDAAWDDEANHYSTGFPIPQYYCLHDSSRKKDNSFTTTYLGISGVGADSGTFPLDHPDAGFFGYDRTLKLKDLSNTSSSTLMILETNTGGPWAQGGHSTVRGIEATTTLGTTTPFGSTHRSGGLFTSNVGANAGTADGSVRFIHHTIDPNVLMTLARIRGEKNAVIE